MNLRLLFIGFILINCLPKAQSQIYDPNQGCVIGPNGECVPNAVLSAMPFLRIVPDARSGAMGDVGIAISPTSNSIHFNYHTSF